MNSSITPNQSNIRLALQNGAFELQGEFLYGSNRTFLCALSYQDQKFGCVYKPARGERPLWDFESGSLARREVAAYLLDSLLGWNAVPVCVYRKDGPFGEGSLHWFVEHDPAQHYFTFSAEIKARLQFVVLFDLLINNADRKAGHFLLDEHSKIWLIDHGLCFHVEEKLRTVVWDFAGQKIPKPLLADIVRMMERLSSEPEIKDELLTLISVEEYEALCQRAEAILLMKKFPNPSEERRMIPWPLV
jgi:hypothetical protein